MSCRAAPQVKRLWQKIIPDAPLVTPSAVSCGHDCTVFPPAGLPEAAASQAPSHPQAIFHL